ncbi:MAG TPA: hypothetical protein VNM43_01165 [Dehalococcoidia bacterium]|nr:hypothetical protein [Dehalococcoidia bacterium]
MPRNWRPYLFLAGVAATATATTYLYIRRRRAQRRGRALGEAERAPEEKAQGAEAIPEFLRAHAPAEQAPVEEPAAPEQTQAP